MTKTIKNYIYKTKPEPNSCELVLDVGGYYGDTGLYAAANGFHSIIFEPMPKFHSYIQKSIESNKFKNSACVFNVNRIINDKPGQVYKLSKHMEFLKIQENNLNQDEKNQIVKSTTIDHIISGSEHLKKCSIRYLKIDSEGYEPNVLFGAIETIRSGRVKSIILEYTVFFQIKNIESVKDWSFLLPFLYSNLSKDKTDLYTLDRLGTNCYGPILESDFDEFYNNHMTRRLQTDILVLIDSELKNMFRNNRVCSSWNKDVMA